MIPIKDINPSRSFPVVNLGIVIVNILVFIYQYIILPRKLSVYFLLSLGCIPYEITHMTDLSPPNLLPPPFTIISSMFLHGGLAHLLSNMLFLWIFGDNVEDKMGHIRYLIFYLLCGVGGAITHIIFNIDSQLPCIGASGAISGVMGAYMLFFPMARIRTLIVFFIFIQLVDIPAFLMIGYWILIQFIFGISEIGTKGGGIAWFAHIGGFLAGLFFAPSMRESV